MADYTVDELFGKLERADAAGDAEAAKVIADEIRRIQAQGAGTAEPEVAEPERSVRATDNMGGMERFRAGIGKGLVDFAEGTAQTLVDNASRPIPKLAEYAARFDPEASRKAADIVLAPQRKLQAHIDERRVLDRDLMDTGAGFAGNMFGSAAPLLAGGGAGLLTKTPSTVAAFLPKSLGANALQGALLGTLQPTETGGSRSLNAVFGGAAGGAITGLMKAPGAILSKAAGLLPAARRAAAESQAGNVIMDYARDPGALIRALSGQAPREIVPGSLPTTAELAGDIGLADLQKTLATGKVGRFDTLLSERHAANNAARTGLLRDVFGGADAASSQAIRSARDAAASRTLAPIRDIPVDVSPVKEGLSDLAQQFAASKTARDALGDVAGEMKHINTVGDAHLVRQTIGHLMGGRLDSRPSAKLAAGQLGQVRDMLDDQMAGAFPAWRNFLQDYSSASRQANQVDLGALLLGKSNSVRDAAGNPVLNANFLRTAGNLDSAARSVNPGFKGGTADAMLDQPQKEAVEAVRMDLERQLRTLDAGKTRGSDTAKNLAGIDSWRDSVGEAGERAVALLDPTRGIASGAIADLRKRAGDRVAMLVSEAMLDPNRAAEILTLVPPQFRDEAVLTVSKALSQAGMSGSRAISQTEQPMEIDIIGGTPVPADQFRF